MATVISLIAFHASAQTTIREIKVEKKPGAIDGQAVATVSATASIKGQSVTSEKKGRIAKHVLQAWPVMDGHGALLLLSPRKDSTRYRLRYYDAGSGKGRFLGVLPFARTRLVQSQGADNSWAFALAGRDPATQSAVIYAGDLQAIHARIDNGDRPEFRNDALEFHTPEGTRRFSIDRLMGRDFQRRILAPDPSNDQHVTYLQFSPDGSSLTFTGSGPVSRGRWITDGASLRVTSKVTPQPSLVVWNKHDLHVVTGIPAGSRIGLRLLQPLSSLTARKGMEVKAISVAPAISRGAILIPLGTEFDGTLTQARSVGWGIRRETAALTVRFTAAKLPDGRNLPIDAWVYEVENSREKVTKDGKIQGIRSTGTIGHSAENKLTALAQVDPMAYLFLSASGPAVLGFAEPEILYNAGTDLVVEFHAPVITSISYASTVPNNGLGQDQLARLSEMVKDLPFRTTTETGNKPSDITNLVFIGKPSSLRRAFDAAGWTTSDTLTAASTFNTMKTLGGTTTYSQAPMSTLLLDGQKPLFALQKTTNTFSARHHLRIFPTKETLDNTTVLTASSTEDIGIAFSRKQKTFIHVIDEYLDNERSKIINDLVFTGCVEDMEMVPRPWVPRDAYNSTGDRLRTDGAAAVLHIDECASPRTTPSTLAQPPNRFKRGERNTALTIKDTLYRGNLIYQGIAGGMKVRSYLAQQGELGEHTGNWRKSDAAGTQYAVRGQGPGLLTRAMTRNAGGPVRGETDLDPAARARIRSHRWDPPRYELAFNAGYSKYRHDTLETTILEIHSPDPARPDFLLGLGDAVYDGWAAGISVTLNSWNYVSNEFSYMRQQTKFELVAVTISSDPQAELGLDTRGVGLVTRRAAYNTVINLRPKKSRWRPYIDGGPVLQLLSLSDAPLKKPDGYFKLGLSNVGLIKAAFDFAGTPPLNGGGMFQPGLQYGVGFKYRVLPRLMLRADYGETWSRNPNIIRDSYLDYLPVGLDESYTTTITEIRPEGSFIQQRATLGVAFTF